MKRLWTSIAVGILLTGGSVAGLAQAATGHRLIACDRGKAIILTAAGDVEWETDLPYTAHDISVLPNGNILLNTGPASITEITPDKKVVWQWDGKPKAGSIARVEIHGFQRLKNGLTMIAETGNRRIIEVDNEGKIVHEIPITVDHPDSHRDTRLARKLDNGHYLVCHEGDGVVREYDENGKVVWSYALELGDRPVQEGHDGHGTHVFSAIRLKNGNTLVGGGDNNRVLEVSPAGKIVWSLDYKELPNIRLYWITTLQQLPNGNLIIGNTHAGPENPQLIEITHDKKVVWTLKDMTHFGNDLCASQVLDVKGKVIR
jgi:hypothetical protein